MTYEILKDFSAAVIIVISNILTISMLFYQLRKNNSIKKAEFIQSTNEIFRQYEDVRAYLRKPEFDITIEKDGVPLFVRVRDYAILFESIYFLVNKKLLSRSQFIDYFGKRFDEFYRHRTVQAILNEPEMNDMRKYLADLHRLVSVIPPS